MSIQPIPRPLLLDPDREKSDDRDEMTLEDHRDRAQRLAEALRESCDYAQMLWTDVARARQYLYDTLPPDPREPASNRTGTTPTGPDDDDGWQQWMDAYAELTSVLAGPHGDSGMGVSEARQAAHLRRSAPNVRLRAAHPEVMEAVAPEPERDPPTRANGFTGSPDSSATPPTTSAVNRIAALGRPVAIGVLAALAVRGVTPRRQRTDHLRS